MKFALSLLLLANKLFRKLKKITYQDLDSTKTQNLIMIRFISPYNLLAISRAQGLCGR
ncbi:hypothetical protein [Helicobacter sp. T3_23-1059]